MFSRFFSCSFPINFFFMADQVARIADRAMVKLLYRMGLEANECFYQLDMLFPKQRPCLRTIEKYYEALSAGTFSYTDAPSVGRSRDEQLISEVDRVVKENPFLSTRRIADRVKSSKETVRRILHENLKLKKRCSRWIPHQLEGDQKDLRVAKARELLSFLKKEEGFDFSHIITGDESWLLYEYPFTSFWGKPEDDPPEMPRKTIGTPKVMLVVFWGVHSTPVLKLLPKGTTMNAETFKSLVVNELVESAKTLAEGESLMIHWDNAPAHTAKTVSEAAKHPKVIILPQPPYSPDIAPSDFFLFGFLKSQLKGKKNQTLKDLEANIREIIGGISLETRRRVMKEWIFRLESVIASGGEYCQ
jgi:hypothetical protein